MNILIVDGNDKKSSEEYEKLAQSGKLDEIAVNLESVEYKRLGESGKLDEGPGAA